jgi:hypothetical protein
MDPDPQHCFFTVYVFCGPNIILPIPAALERFACEEAGAQAEEADGDQYEGDNDYDRQEESCHPLLDLHKHLLHFVPHIGKTTRACQKEIYISHIKKCG